MSNQAKSNIKKQHLRVLEYMIVLLFELKKNIEFFQRIELASNKVCERRKENKQSRSCSRMQGIKAVNQESE